MWLNVAKAKEFSSKFPSLFIYGSSTDEHIIHKIIKFDDAFYNNKNYNGLFFCGLSFIFFFCFFSFVVIEEHIDIYFTWYFYVITKGEEPNIDYFLEVFTIFTTLFYRFFDSDSFDFFLEVIGLCFFFAYDADSYIFSLDELFLFFTYEEFSEVSDF